MHGRSRPCTPSRPDHIRSPLQTSSAMSSRHKRFPSNQAPPLNPAKGLSQTPPLTPAAPKGLSAEALDHKEIPSHQALQLNPAKGCPARAYSVIPGAHNKSLPVHSSAAILSHRMGSPYQAFDHKGPSHLASYQKGPFPQAWITKALLPMTWIIRALFHTKPWIRRAPLIWLQITRALLPRVPPQ